MLLTIITFLVILSLLALAHEWGHFITARKSGVKVEEFGIGLPPRMFGFRKGETVYSVNWLPLGGFCALKGEAGENAADKDSFSGKKIWRRAVILCGGVAMNMVLAAMLLSVGFFIGLPQVLNGNADQLRAKDVKIQVISVMKNSPAQTADIAVGDIILEIDGQEFSEVEAIQNYIKAKEGPAALTLKRGGEELTKELTPRILEPAQEDLPTGEKPVPQKLIGVGLVKTGIIPYPWYQAIWYGCKDTVTLTGRILVAFYDLFKDMIVKRQVSTDISGPVGIAVMTGQVVHLGFSYVLQFAAILSINLAILNLLPFPALDGGRLLFLVIEKVRRKPVDRKLEATIHGIGYMILLGLIALVTFRDIGKFGAKMLEALKNMLNL